MLSINQHSIAFGFSLGQNSVKGLFIPFCSSFVVFFLLLPHNFFLIVDEQTLRSVYHCLIYSHLQYCISSWGTASKSTLAPLFILQKRSIRLLTGSGYREHTNPLFYRAKCLKLNDIYSLETAKLMYKIHNNVLSFTNSDKFNLIKNCYTHKTRLTHKNNCFLPRTRTRLGQKSLSFAGIKIWNEIPSILKEVSFYRFKKAVKAHFLSTYETDRS